MDRILIKKAVTVESLANEQFVLDLADAGEPVAILDGKVVKGTFIPQKFVERADIRSEAALRELGTRMVYVGTT